MHYVYLLRSLAFPDQTYIGQTDKLKARLQTHIAGGSPHTAKFRPWKLVTYLGFHDKKAALDLENYLKTGSGQAFAKKRLWGE